MRPRVYKLNGMWTHFCPRAMRHLRFYSWDTAIESALTCYQKCYNHASP
jgi:glycogen synthase